MKILFILLFAACSLNAGDIRIVKTDIRVVGTNQVDLTPIHEWASRGQKDADRPMRHWKIVKIETVQPKDPWPTGSIRIDRQEHKSVFLKNIPEEIRKYLSDVGDTMTRIESLTPEIRSDVQRLKVENGANINPYSEFNRNRKQFQANLVNKQKEFNRLLAQFKYLKSKEEINASDLAMFTGQITNNIEVWDFGVKQ